MILVFGGTTEGRRAVEVLEKAGTAYYYSTKTEEQEVALHHGIRLHGALDYKAIMTFCKEHEIRLLIDAAHPFAQQLHAAIAEIAEKLHLPAIRYERIFPERDRSLTWIDDYAQIPTDVHSLLATTGVQTISKLKPLEAQGIKVFYRILPRESSIRLAKEQGASDEQLLYYEDSTVIDVDAEAILLKESGLSGGFQEKVDAAKAKGMRIIVLKRPATPGVFHIVNGPHGLRRMVERLLPEFYPLHSGLTSGTCATAAAVGAAMMMVQGSGFRIQGSGLRVKGLPQEVPVVLPDGETIHVPVTYGDGYVSLFKEAGDDPDVTNGIEIRASVVASETFEIRGGEGVGHFTLPGFDYPPGEPAINKGPREMIRRNLEPFTMNHESLTVVISVPQGEEIAKRTFNPRLGIEGGISIIGVSGIVEPFSEEAFIQSIRKCMKVAKASGTERVVINSGAKSERFVKAHYPTLPSQAFVEYGNYIGETLKIANELGFRKVTLGVMLGKAVKLAEGQLDTHSRKGTMNLAFVQQMLDEANCQLSIVNSQLSLARELWEKLPKEKTEAFSQVVIRYCMKHCKPLVSQADLTLLLIADDGTIHSL